jgi:hypothetical protein
VYYSSKVIDVISDTKSLRNNSVIVLSILWVIGMHGEFDYNGKNECDAYGRPYVIGQIE